MYNLTICQCLYLKKRIDPKIDGWNANKHDPNLGVPNWQPNSKPYLYSNALLRILKGLFQIVSIKHWSLGIFDCSGMFRHHMDSSQAFIKSCI